MIDLIQALMEELKPKAHDAINALTQKWESRHDNGIYEQIMDFSDSPFNQEDIMGMSMGIGGGGANIGKAGKNILSKILARNAKTRKNLAKARKNLRPGAPIRGQQTLKPEDTKYLSEGWRKWEELTKEISASKNPEMKKYIGRLREELSPHYSGPTGSWHQGRFNPNYESPSGGEVAGPIGTLLLGMLLMGMKGKGHFEEYGELEGDVPNIGLPPKQR